MTAMQDLIGYAAAVLTTISFVPQVWQTWRTRDVSGISLPMYAAFATGVFLWLVYGLMAGAWPIVVANGTTLALALGILAMKLLWGRSSPTSARAGDRTRSRPAASEPTAWDRSDRPTTKSRN